MMAMILIDWDLEIQKKNIDEIEKISKLPNLNVEGIFFSFANLKQNKEEDEKQYRKLLKVIENLPRKGVKF